MKITLQEIQEILSRNKCLENMDLSNMDLRGLNFSNASLSGANLSGADLRGAVGQWKGTTSLMLNIGTFNSILAFTSFTQWTNRRSAFAVAFVVCLTVLNTLNIKMSIYNVNKNDKIISNCAF